MCVCARVYVSLCVCVRACVRACARDENSPLGQNLTLHEYFYYYYHLIKYSYDLGCFSVRHSYCISTSWLHLSGSVLQAYIAACAVFGWSLGLVVTCAPLACAELVGVHQYAPALGYQFFVAGLATSIGGPLGGTSASVCVCVCVVCVCAVSYTHLTLPTSSTV